MSAPDHLQSSNVVAKGYAKLDTAINERNSQGENIISEQEKKELYVAFDEFVIVARSSPNTYCDVIAMKEFR
jgi:hypothetical protein